MMGGADSNRSGSNAWHTKREWYQSYLAHWRSLDPDVDEDFLAGQLGVFLEHGQLAEALCVFPHSAELLERVQKLTGLHSRLQRLHDMPADEARRELDCADEELLALAQECQRRVTAATEVVLDERNIEVARCSDPYAEYGRCWEESFGTPESLLCEKFLDALHDGMADAPAIAAAHKLLYDPLIAILDFDWCEGYAEWVFFRDRVTCPNPYDILYEIAYRGAYPVYSEKGRLRICAPERWK